MARPVRCKQIAKHTTPPFGGLTHYSQTTAETAVVSVRVPSGTHDRRAVPRRNPRASAQGGCQGSSKLADEALISTHAHSYDLTAWVFRFASIVGPHQRGNVIPDFIEKLLADPTQLEILGDGRQEKSYMHVRECVDAIRYVVEHANDDLNTYNLGTRTTTSVTAIADIVSDELGVEPEYTYTGGDRGWTGDVPKMRLSIEKLSGLGWEPSQSSHEAVRRGIRNLVGDLAPDQRAAGE